MRVDLLTKEYPPEIYGGAGVHVTELVRALRKLLHVEVRCFGEPRTEQSVTSYRVPETLIEANSALGTVGVDLQMAEDVGGADLVHSHTWYANAAGRFAQLLHGIPHVATAHSLEPLRPWKAEQLGGGYRLSSWLEAEALTTANAVIAVSAGMRDDILRCYPQIPPRRVHVIGNGIDTEGWSPLADTETLGRYGVDPNRTTVAFVGRITRQKGLQYLLQAALDLPANVQLVLCAGAADTAQIRREIEQGVSELRRQRTGVIWIEHKLSRDELRAILTHASVFVCPSIYEPLGIVNLEAMACGTAVVATATGGIPEVVDDGVTGRLVPIQQVADGTGTPLDSARFVSDLARTINEVLANPTAAEEMGRAGRARAVRDFGWQKIAAATRDLYQSLV